MTVNDDKRNGVFCYEFNDKDLGIAYDNIDNEKRFCFAMSLYWNDDTYGIIENKQISKKMQNACCKF